MVWSYEGTRPMPSFLIEGPYAATKKYISYKDLILEFDRVKGGQLLKYNFDAYMLPEEDLLKPEWDY